MTTPRQLWNDAKAGCPDAILILEADDAWYVYGEDAVAVKYAMGNVSNPTGDQINAALEELTSRGTKVVFAKKENDHGSQSADTGSKRQAETNSLASPPAEETMPALRKAPLKYAADPWTSYTGPQGGKGWVNSQTGRVFYGPNKPGRDEPGEEIEAPPQAAGRPVPTMSDPIPLPPGTAKGLGATEAPGLPNFQEPPGPGEPGGEAEWGSTESLASLYGRDGMSKQTAQRFNMSAAKLMGLEIPEGQKEQQAALAEEFLRHNAQQLAQTMNAAKSMGWKPRGKRLITNAGSAGRWIVGQAEAQGYERQGGGMTAELAGAVSHLQGGGGAPEHDQGLTATVEAYGAMSRLVAPLLALPLAIAYGYINKGGTSAVAGANTHLDQLSERLGIRSPFVATTRVDPKPEKPIKLRPEDFLDEPKREPKAPAETTTIQPKTRTITPEDLPEASPKAPAQRTRRQVGAEMAGETRQENARLLQQVVDQMPEAVRSDFTTQYKALLDDRSQTISKIRGQRDELLANIAGTQGMGAMTRQIQRADDPAQVKGFDLLVQLVENAPGTYADLVGVGELGQSAGDVESRLFDVLKRPKGYFQPPQAHEVADELASEWFRQESAAEERSASQMDAEAETASFDPSSDTFGEGPAVDPDEFDPQAEPFAKEGRRRARKGGEWVDGRKYRGGEWIPGGQAKKYAFKESEHPREEKGKAEGGRFAEGEREGDTLRTFVESLLAKGESVTSIRKRVKSSEALRGRVAEIGPLAREILHERHVASAPPKPLVKPSSPTSPYVTRDEAIDIQEQDIAAPTSPEFLAWFNQSKIVDENGEPLIVYHGTGSPGFLKFKVMGESDAVFFARDPDEAKHAWGTQEGVYPVYLSLKNPLALTAEESISIAGEPKEENELFERARAAGHDGVVFDSDDPDETIYVVFDTTDIKSATANRGSFNPKDPRIDHAKDPYAQKFALALRTGKLPNLSRLEDPEATIAEADRVLAATHPGNLPPMLSR